MKKIKNFEGYYVTKTGKVYSRKQSKLVELKGNVEKQGYVKVGLYNNGKSHSWRIHRLVAQAFIDNPLNKPQVNHINGIKSDNRVENLEWNTTKENQIHSSNNGFMKRGMDCNLSKLTEEQVIEIRELKGKLSQREIAKLFNSSQSNIGQIHRRESWRHLK